MFPHTWRNHWGLDEDPFVHEDADKDPVLTRLGSGVVHSSFDRLFGTPDAPAPGIVFGEKGSGKSSLRLTMRRRLEEAAGGEPGTGIGTGPGGNGGAFVVEYVEFDTFLNEARKSDRLPPAHPKTARRVVERFQLADHVDAILALGVTQLADGLCAGTYPAARKLAPKRKAAVLALAALYYRSSDRSTDEADRGVRRALRFRSMRPFAYGLAKLVATVVGVLLLLVPHAGLVGLDLGLEDVEPRNWYIGGAALLAVTWGWHALQRLRSRRQAGKATRAVRVVPRDSDQLARLLGEIPSAVRRDLSLPESGALAPRLVLLQRFIGVLRELGHPSFYVLLDRVDEATMLGGRAELMRPFVELLLEHRLLQFEGLALKLFLPIELSRLYLGASPDELKTMRLDKANAVPELRWTGQELSQVAAERLRAARPDHGDDSPGGRLMDYFGEDVTEDEIREALGELGTPRLAFGFLGALFSEHARELADELPAEDPNWLVPRRRFDVLRSAWSDKARVLRRTMN